MPYFKHPAAGDRTLRICRALIEPKPNIPIRVGSGPPARYNDYRPRHSLTMAANKNLRSNKCTAKLSYFFNTRKGGVLRRHCLQNYLRYALHKIMSNLILDTSLCQPLGTVPWYTMSKYTIKSPIPPRSLSLSPQKVTQE